MKSVFQSIDVDFTRYSTKPKFAYENKTHMDLMVAVHVPTAFNI